MAWCSYGYDPLGLGKDTAQVEKYRDTSSSTLGGPCLLLLASSSLRASR